MPETAAQILRSAGAHVGVHHASSSIVLDAAVQLYWRRRFPHHKPGRFLLRERSPIEFREAS